MKVKLCAPIALIAFLSYVPQCYHAQRASSRASSRASTTISNDFAWNLFRNSINPNNDEENFILSPLTVLHLLSLLQHGAQGSTNQQIKKVTENVNATQLYHILNPRNGESPEVKSASGIFIDSNDRVNEDASQYIYASGGDILELPLQNDPVFAKKFINSWASNATEGHIPEFLNAESDLSRVRALLASAIYFHSSWKHKFMPSESRTFLITPNKKVNGDYMVVDAYLKMRNVNLDKNNWGTVITLPYKENRYSMFLIIPGPLTELNVFLDLVNSNKFSNLIQNPSQLPSTKLKLFMPKFKASSKISLVSSLQKMGLVDIFSPSKSRLTKLLDGQAALWVDEVLQQSTLDVDQFGTTATSVTGVSVVPLSAAEPDSQVFIIDVPFLAVIVENANQTPLFIAKITNPAIKA